MEEEEAERRMRKEDERGKGGRFFLKFKTPGAGFLIILALLFHLFTIMPSFYLSWCPVGGVLL